MNFGQAIEALKNGHAVTREGWHRVGMSLVIRKGSIDYDYYGCGADTKLQYPHGSTINGVDFGLFEMGDKDTVARMPNIRMAISNETIVDGWLASQMDMLAEDWKIVSE